jgi:hypothetical protein
VTALMTPAEASLDGCLAQCNGYVRFSGAVAANADHVLLLSDELTVGQGQDLGSWQRGYLLEVELTQCL